MNLHQLINGISIAMSNEERDFVQSHRSKIPLSSISGKDITIARSLVRKNIYTMSDDSAVLIKNDGSNNVN